MVVTFQRLNLYLVGILLVSTSKKDKYGSVYLSMAVSPSFSFLPSRRVLLSLSLDHSLFSLTVSSALHTSPTLPPERFDSNTRYTGTVYGRSIMSAPMLKASLLEVEKPQVGCVVNGQVTKASNKRVPPPHTHTPSPPPPPALPPPC